MLKTLTWILLVAAVLRAGLACTSDSGGGGGSKKPDDKPKGDTAKDGGAKDGGSSSGDGGLKDALGGDIKTSPQESDTYTSKGGGPVASGNDLKCDFESGCCWENLEPPQDQLQWVSAEGKPDPAKAKLIFGTDAAPTGKYLATGLGRKTAASDEARFKSCTIQCSQSDIKVKLKHWSSPDVKLQVCTLPGFVGNPNPNDSPPLNCQDLPQSASPGPTEVVLPPGEFTDIVIIASNFVNERGGIAAIDDIEVTSEPCAESKSNATAAPPSGNSTAGSSTPAGNNTGGPKDPNCDKVACGFDKKDLCSYTPVQSDGSEIKQVNAPPGIGNLVTGVRKTHEGAKDTSFAGVELKPGQKTRLETKELSLTEDRVISFWSYKATQDIVTKVCLDDDSKCPFTTEQNVNVSDRAWKKSSVTVPKGTKKIIFIGENKGKQTGAVALDDVELLLPPKDGSNDPTKATDNAC